MFQQHRHGCRALDFSSSNNRFLTLENDIFKMTFWLNKGADLVEIRHKAKDTDVLWRNPVPMFAVGNYISPANPAGGNFFDYYPGGWQEVFPNAHSSTDRYKKAPLGAHGEVCLLPWEYTIMESSEECLVVLLSVRTARTPFRLEKKVKLTRGSPFFIMEEKITNEGNETMHYNWGHHPAFGPPFVQEGCVIDAPDQSVAIVPGSDETGNCRFAAGANQTWPFLQTSGGVEDGSLILHEHAGTADSFYLKPTEGWVAFRNPKLDVGVGMVWDLSTFPYLWIWQAYCGNEGYPFYKRNYNVALEPFSVPIQTLPESIEDGNANMLAAHQSKETCLLFGFTEGQQRIRHISDKGVVTAE